MTSQQTATPTSTPTNETPPHATFTVERSYRSSPARVFGAFSDAASKRTWFAEGPTFELDEYTLDFRVGGREFSSFRVSNPGFESAAITNDTYYFDISEGQRIVFGYSMANVGVPFSVSLTTITLTPSGSGTMLTHSETVQFLDGSDGLRMREWGTRSLYEHLARHLGEKFDAEALVWKG